MNARSWWAAARSGSDSSRWRYSRRALGPALALVRRVQPAEEEGAGEVLARLGEIRVDAQRRAELGLRGVGAPGCEQRLAEVGVPLGELGGEPDRPLEAAAGELELARAARHDAEAVVRFGEVGIEGERVLEGDAGALEVRRGEIGVPAAELLARARVDGRARRARGDEDDDGERTEAVSACAASPLPRVSGGAGRGERRQARLGR